MKKDKIGHGEAYSRKKDQAIGNLLTCRTVGEAARQTGVGEKTLRRWLDRPDFQQDYDRARRHSFERTVSRLADLGPRAIDKLESEIRYGEDAVKVAMFVLGMILKFKKADSGDEGENFEQIASDGRQRPAGARGTEKKPRPDNQSPACESTDSNETEDHIEPSDDAEAEKKTIPTEPLKLRQRVSRNTAV